jgi:hypothetical protein
MSLTKVIGKSFIITNAIRKNVAIEKYAAGTPK